MNKTEELDQLNARYTRSCTCSLRETATQAVPGTGSAEARLFFIGEAPGKNEDEQGIPFVGASGKFLNEMLGSIGLRREDIYITNTVKYRPPKNRDPLPEEKQACRKWLLDQIRLIDPELIIPLGRHALEYLLPDVRISEAHGQVFTREFPDLGTRTFFPLYHPAAALYNGSLRATLKEDFLKIPALLKEKKV